MPVTVLDYPSRLIDARAERDYVGYHEYERWRYESLLTNELTDQSERLAKPMENPSVYMRDEKGKLYKEFDGDRHYLEKILNDGLTEAAGMAQLYPEDWGFEHERRGIEREELDDVQSLKDGEKMQIMSIIPDKVRAGQTNINGYDRERMKTIVRLFERRGDEVLSRSFSLDRSDYEGLQFAAATVGVEIPDGLTSEEFLANRHRFDASNELSIVDVHNFVRDGYDLYLERKLGGKWYAGRRAIDKVDALSFIKAQPDLIAQHMSAIKDIMAKALDTDNEKHLLETARYNFAAALDFRMNGREVDVLSDAGDTARSEGRSFDGDCPTGSAAGQAEQMGYNQGRAAELGAAGCGKCRAGVTHIHECVNCPLCSTRNVTARYTENDITCLTGCKKTLNKKTGQITRDAGRSAGNLGRLTLSDLVEQVREERRQKVEEEATAIDLAARRQQKLQTKNVAGTGTDDDNQQAQQRQLATVA